MKPILINESLGLVQSALEQWLSFKNYLVLGSTSNKISQEDENSFLEIKSNLSRSNRALGEKMKEAGRMDLGEKLLKELLTKCVSISNISSLPPPDKRQLMRDWHKVYIKMSRSIGALKMLSEGYVPEDATKKKKKKKFDVSTLKTPIIAIVIIGVLVGVLKFMGIF